MKFWAGGGFFVRYTTLPLPLAWDAFGTKNGAISYRALQNMIGQLRSHDDGRTPEIGCSILAQPFFWDQEDWIPMGEDFARNIVAGKTFDSIEPAGARLPPRFLQRAPAALRFPQAVRRRARDRHAGAQGSGERAHPGTLVQREGLLPASRPDSRQPARKPAGPAEQ